MWIKIPHKNRELIDKHFWWWNNSPDKSIYCFVTSNADLTWEDIPFEDVKFDDFKKSLDINT